MSLFAASERRTKTIGVRFYEAEDRALRREARKERVAVGVLIRRVMGAWLARQERRAKRGRSGRALNTRNAKGV